MLKAIRNESYVLKVKSITVVAHYQSKLDPNRIHSEGKALENMTCTAGALLFKL